MFVVTFLNARHKKEFEKKTRKVNRENYKLLSAVYLLTADYKLLKVSYRQIRNNKIIFKNIKSRNLSDKGYTLLCAAKDLFYGTKYISVSDLCNKFLMSPKMVNLICNAIIIKRSGLNEIIKGGE